MKITITFWTHTLAWAVALAALFTALSLAGGGPDEALVHFPGWLGLGLALGTFPAGVRLAPEVLPEDRQDPGALALLALNAAIASAGFILLAGVVAPAFVPAAPAGDVVAAARGMDLGELRAALEDAVRAADPDGDLAPTTIREWWPVNVLAWHYYARLAGAALPVLFATIGAMAGFWARRVTRPEARAAQILAVGLLLLVSTYLANENSFEWIVVQAAGPVPFAGLFALIVPSLLALGLAWPTALTWRGRPAR